MVFTRISRLYQKGASLVEFVVVAPTLLMMILGVIQTGLVFHAKSNVNYAAFEAARAGTVSHASKATMRDAFQRAMMGYHGGGRTTAELAQAKTRVLADITPASLQIDILSPTKESFDDFASPALAKRLGVNTRVIPNTNIAFISCPLDKPACNSNPASNASGQTLQDANLLKIKITYGIPQQKQVPLIGKFYNWYLKTFPPSDAFQVALVTQNRIPIVTSTTMRMQSEAFENGNESIPGAGNEGNPVDPDEDASEPPNENNPPAEDEDEECDPLEDLFGCKPIGCKAGDPSCDPACKTSCCTETSVLEEVLGIGQSTSSPNSSSIPSGVGVFTSG
jgi:hypothetical protein